MSKDEVETSEWLQKLDKTIIDTKPNSKSHRQRKYTEKDLRGIEVEHDIDEFEAGSSKILVAQDVDVLDDESGDIRLVSSTADRAKKHPNKNATKPNVAFSFADEEEAVDEKKSFRIGEITDNRTIMSANESENSKFDATLATTTEIIGISSLGTKRKRVIRKKTSEMFTDEPTFQPLQQLQSPSQDMDVGDEDDQDISLALAKSRQKNIELLRRHFRAEQEQSDLEESDFKTANTNGLVISDVSDFLASVKRPERLKRAKVEVKDETEATLISGNALKETSTVGMEEVLQQNSKEKEEQEEKYENDGEEGFIDEPLVSKGVASTLAFLSSRGMGLKINTTNEPFDFSDITLQYHDEFGNVISAKEAYKQLSHRFHGKGPGKNKEEKRLKKISESAKMKKTSMSGDGSAGLQRSKQKESGEAHIMLAKGNKGVQPSQAATLAPVKAEAEKRPSKPVPAKKPKIFGML